MKRLTATLRRRIPLKRGNELKPVDRRLLAAPFEANPYEKRERIETRGAGK